MKLFASERKRHTKRDLKPKNSRTLYAGNFTFYSKSLVYRQQNVYLAQDMFSTSYVSGAGTAFFSCKEDYEAYCSGTARSDAKSIFALLAPYSSREYANPMDLTGHYGGNISALQENDEYHFPTAPFYQAHWGWRSPAPDAPGRPHFDNGDCVPNTLVFQVRGGTPLKPPVFFLKVFVLTCFFSCRY